MKVYNSKTNRIEELNPTIQTDNGILYTSKMSEVELNNEGIYFIEYKSKPNRRYYTYTEESSLVDNKYVVSYTTIDRPISEVHESMLQDLSKAYAEYKDRPKVDTGLGFVVDGGYNDIKNFEIGKKYALPEVKDANNNKHSVTISDYDTILSAIELNGISLFVTKDTKEQEIRALTTVEDCILYEATPYEETVDVVDEMTGEPIGETQVVTKYRNNVKEW